MIQKILIIYIQVNTRFGFGLLNAAALTEAANNWINVPRKSICEILPVNFQKQYVKSNQILFKNIFI